MMDSRDKLKAIYRQVETNTTPGDTYFITQLHAEVSELRKSQEALKKAHFRQKSEIEFAMQLQEEARVENTLPVPELSAEETQNIVDSVKDTPLPSTPSQ